MKLLATPLAVFALFLSQAIAADEAEPAKKTLKLQVEGMKCEGCAFYLTSVLKEVEGIGESFVSVKHQMVVVQEASEEPLTDEFLNELLDEAGYKPKAIERTAKPLATVKAELEASEAAPAS